MYYVYVLKSKNNDFYYKGFTSNIEKRLKEHESGKTSSNKAFRPFKLIYVDICETRKEARKMELFLKSGYGRDILKEIEADVVKLVYTQS